MPNPFQEGKHSLLTQRGENEREFNFPVQGAMAAGGPVQDLWDEATCPICQEYFTDPVIIAKCGHNFCQACLTQCWGEEDTDVTCPQCRETIRDKNFIPNRQLANFVAITKKLNLQGQAGAREVERVCEKHQEPLKLFCKDHQTPICVVCDRAKEHESHKVVPREEALQEYQEKIFSRLIILRAEREKIQMYKRDAEKESQDLLKQMAEERQKTMAEFREIHQFLEEQEKILLAQIDGVEKEIARRREEHMATLSRELSSLENIIPEMEEKCQQPAGEFLQDIRKTLQRFEMKEELFENPVGFPPELTCRIRELCVRNSHLERVMNQFPRNEEQCVYFGQHFYEAKVTLDPDTAHPRLILSEDRKSVRWGEKYQKLPNSPERFDYWFCVLGLEGFTAGRHFWDVTVENEGSWDVGIARKSVRRKGRFHLGPEEGIWAVGKWGGQCRVLNPPDYPPLSLRQKIKRIRVCLNCDEGQVSFSDADTGVQIYTHSGASFCGETLLPFFCVIGKAHLRLSP